MTDQPVARHPIDQVPWADPASLEAAVRRVLQPGATVTFLNPFSALQVRAAGLWPWLARDVDAVFSDGMLLTALRRGLRRAAPARRYSFDWTSLAPGVLAQCEARGWRIAWVGGPPEVQEAVRDYIARRYPGLAIVHARDGFFDDDAQRAHCIREVAASGADLVIVGMGGGAQERFMRDLRAGGCTAALVSCGAFLEQTGRWGRTYPRWADRFHLRWAVRVWHDPRTMLHRYGVLYPRGLAWLFLGRPPDDPRG